jgi:hypothetical protein
MTDSLIATTTTKETKGTKMLLEALQTLLDNGLPEKEIGSIVLDLLDADGFEDSDDIKAIVLLYVLDDAGDGIDCAIEVSRHDDCSFEVGGREYLVLDDSERDSRWDESLESYLDECGVEGADSSYFDRERWKKDARMDGAGHTLASYDGDEREFKACDEWYYIYRTG